MSTGTVTATPTYTYKLKSNDPRGLQGPATYKTITVTLCSPNVGAEISNVDLTKPLNEEQVREIRAAITAHGVLFFRDQKIDFESHERFVRYFGQPHEHVGGDGTASQRIPGYPGIRKQFFDANSKRVAGEEWHSDQSYSDIPPTYSILYQQKVPTNGGGDTMFLSCSKAYEELSQGMKDYLKGKTATHTGGKSFNDPGTGARPAVAHPIVARHPESGRQLLFVNRGFTSHINDVSEMESKAILGFLYDHIELPHWQTRFRWTDHSIAMWDNRCVQHRAIWDYWPAVRQGYRMFLEGTERPMP